MNIRKMLRTGAAIKLLLLLVIGCVSEYELKQSAIDAQWVMHTQEVLDELQSLRISVRGVEMISTNARMINALGQLERFRAVQQQLTGRLDRLKGLTADNPLQQKWLNSLQALGTGNYQHETRHSANNSKTF